MTFFSKLTPAVAMKRFHITPSVVKNTENLEKLRKLKREEIVIRNRTDKYYNQSHHEAEQISKYGYKQVLFDQLPQMVNDFTAGLTLYEQLPNITPFLLESTAYKIELLILNKDDYHYNLPLDRLFSNGIVDNLIECCRSRHWPTLRGQAADTLRELIRHGTMAQNEEMLRRGVIPIFLQMLNDEKAIDLDDGEWLDSLVIVKAVEALALLSTKLDVGGDLVREFVEQNLCGRLMLLFRDPTHAIVENGLTFVENFLTRGSEDQIQVLLDNQVLHHLRLVTDNPAGANVYGQYRAAEALGNFARRSIMCRDLVINSGADLIPLFRVLNRLVTNVMNQELAAMSAARTIGYLCFGSPSPPFDKLRPSLPILRFLINDLEPLIEEAAGPAIKHACLIIACLARGGFDPINALIDGNMCPRLVILLGYPDSEVVASALKVMENFFRNGTENQIQVLHDNQVLQRFLEILINNENRPFHLKYVCRAIANIVNYRSSQIQRLVDAAIFPPIINISINQEVGDTKYEAIYAISIAARRGSHQQIIHLVDHGSVAVLTQGLLCEGYTRKASCFQGLRSILRVGEAHKVDGVNIYTQMVTENGGLARIKSQRDDPDVGEIARRLLSSYWPGKV